MTYPLVVLRPEPGASATAARARAAGLTVVVAPLFEIRPLAWTLPGESFDALLLTSANAVRMVERERLPALPAYAVGAATARAAREAGLKVVSEGAGDGAAALASARGEGRRCLLHLAGRERSAGLGGADVVTVPVYAADPILPPNLPEKGVALLHSARAAARFAELVERSGYSVVAISAPALAAAGTGWALALAASEPRDAAMLSLAGRVCERG